MNGKPAMKARTSQICIYTMKNKRFAHGLPFTRVVTRYIFFATDSIFLPKMLLWSQKGWAFLSLNPFLLLAWSLIPWKTRLIPIQRVVIPNPAALTPDPGPFQGFDSWSRIPRYDPALQFRKFNCHSPPINDVNWPVLKLTLDDNCSLFFVTGLFRNFFTLSEP